MLYLFTYFSVFVPILASSVIGRWGPPDNLPACSAQVDGLISGIEINILAQQGERNATEALQAIEASSPVDMTEFAAGKAVLVSDIMFGMTIRRYNLLIAPAGNAALSGLATVCCSRMAYKGLVHTDLSPSMLQLKQPSSDSHRV